MVITFSAEALVGAGATMRLGYSLDGAGCFPQAGPTFFSSSSPVAVSTAIHVIPLGSGAHTIQACFSAAQAGTMVRLLTRTLIAEGQTK